MRKSRKITQPADALTLALTSPGQYSSLGAAFQDIRNYLAGRAIGITQDRYLLEEVVKCLFCFEHLSDSAKRGAADNDLLAKYSHAFENVKSSTNGTFDKQEVIQLDAEAVAFIHKIFKQVKLDDPLEDPLSEAYQAFIGSAVRNQEGQFFTPVEAVRWLVEAVAPRKGEKIIDPACGAGSFLSFSARYLRAHGVSRADIRESIYGIEKDKYLTKLASTHLALTTLRAPHVICADSIDRKTLDGSPIDFDLDQQFDIVFANPPFGSKIKIGSDATKATFDLAFKWAKDAKTGSSVRTNQLLASPTPQTLFLELCIRLLRPGGRLGIVVPESMISSPTASYVSQYLLEKSQVDAVIGMPESLFKTSGKGGTHTKTCLVVATKRPTKQRQKARNTFMAEAKWCGHDSRGSPIPHNDLPPIFRNFKSSTADASTPRLGYLVGADQISNYNLAPRYYDPTSSQKLAKIARTHEFLKIQDLVDDGVLQFSTGDEVGKLAYGTGDIPFVRTSDISSWEIKIDPKHGVSEDIYQQLAAKQDVREGDILMVRDGTYLIGTCAYLSKYDCKIIYQSHIYKIRVLDTDRISPYLLLAALSSSPVVQQIQSKRVTQDIIDTLGNRVYELVLPMPKQKTLKKKIEQMVKTSIHDRVEARELARAAKLAIVEGV